ncbi:uncharacterized protein [Rutidosis leptorrhynchoides]|uniref:uncharacterized protein n=1 Tax=Rutidosis leptorrhynchoides TaxID=125765 RepID=UPI003A9A2988
MGVKNMKKVPVLLIMVMCCLSSMAEAEYFKYKDPKQPMGIRIKDLMKRMTLEEKIGQMTQIDHKVASNKVINKYLIGSVFSGGGSVPAKHASPQTWVDMVNDYQKGAISTCLGIPIIYGIDVVHGHNNVYKATIFPHNVGLGVTRDPVLAKKIGAATALEVRATGTTILSAVKKMVDPKTKVVYNENPSGEMVKSGKFDYAIVVVREHPYAESFGDSMNLTIAEPGLSTIQNVCGSVICVVIVISGRPVVVELYVKNIDALVAAWLPGTEGQGVVDALFGDYAFTGKLART